jgi:ABC-type transporter Mla maintaining outer membrane lipid asymmetry ATPase subunit MlaF
VLLNHSIGIQADDLIREHLLIVDDGLPAPKIRVRGLCRLSDTTGEEILRGVHLDVSRGVVMGPSGSGMSTLLRALNRLWEPAPATVFLDGADICALDVLALRRKVGMLFQLPAMFQGTGRRSRLHYTRRPENDLGRHASNPLV